MCLCGSQTQTAVCWTWLDVLKSWMPSWKVVIVAGAVEVHAAVVVVVVEVLAPVVD